MASRYPVPYSSSRPFGGSDPFMELHREMDRLFDVFSGGGALATSQSAGGALSAPRIDVREDEREICIMADLPGVKPSEVEVRLDGDMLTICGEKKTEMERKDENYHVMERGYGRFRRNLQLPFTPDPDQVKADCSHGVLTVRLPKQAQMERSRRIEVREGGDGQGQGVEVGTQQRPAGQAGAGKEAPGSTSHH